MSAADPHRVRLAHLPEDKPAMLDFIMGMQHFERADRSRPAHRSRCRGRILRSHHGTDRQEERPHPDRRNRKRQGARMGGGLQGRERSLRRRRGENVRLYRGTLRHRGSARSGRRPRADRGLRGVGARARAQGDDDRRARQETTRADRRLSQRRVSRTTSSLKRKYLDDAPDRARFARRCARDGRADPGNGGVADPKRARSCGDRTRRRGGARARGTLAGELVVGRVGANSRAACICTTRTGCSGRRSQPARHSTFTGSRSRASIRRTRLFPCHARMGRERGAQRRAGRILRLDCEPRAKLLALYRSAGYSRIDPEPIQVGEHFVVRHEQRV